MSYEKVHVFASNLVGILTFPTGDPSVVRRRPAILLSNVGVSHRVGPFRFNVLLARLAASMGFAAFRFDFSGLGDSEASLDGRTDQQRALSEAQSAMDLVTKRTGAERFVMIGLCSGADKTHIVASADPRIVGAAFIDGYAYKTPFFYVLRYTSRFLQWKRFKVFVKAQWRAAKARLAGEKAADEEYRAIIASPERAGVERQLAAMADRGVKQLHLFTVSTDYTYNYQRQFWGMYPALKGKRNVVSERYPEVDHTLSVVAMQEKVLGRLGDWIKEFDT